MALAGSASARRAMPQISGIAHRLWGLGHCQKKNSLPQEIWGSMIAEEQSQIRAKDRERRRDRCAPATMVLLGMPGSGKGTFGSKLAKLLDVPHISTGDLIREELKNSAAVAEIVSKGKLLSDEEVIELLAARLERGAAKGEKGFVLDGFPRTVNQALVLDRVASIDVAVNFAQDRGVLIRKCLGRRVCGECGRIFSLADVSVGDSRMPAILPPIQCLDKMVTRKDDSEESIRNRLQVYDEESKPVEEFYRKKGKLVNFRVPGSVIESWPKLLQALKLNLDHQQEGEAPAATISSSCC